MELTRLLTNIISETNGISLSDTLELLRHFGDFPSKGGLHKVVDEFRKLLSDFQQNKVGIEPLLVHPVSDAFFEFFKKFPLQYREEHIHLTGSLTPEFIFPRLQKLLNGPLGEEYKKKIVEVYGEKVLPIDSVEDVRKLICLKGNDRFEQYLKILYLPKLILNSRNAHREAAYHMASELNQKYNIGKIRLKFTLSRSSGIVSEQIPGIEELTISDVVMGLYDGLIDYKEKYPNFNFVLSPCFRKEQDFFDKTKFSSKQESFDYQVDELIELLERHPELKNFLYEVDTVGDERELFRKTHFLEMKSGLRKLQYKGFRIRSHHGETWKTLRRGVQSVDNAMNIWHIDTLEHGLSLGINPNFYFHRLFQRTIGANTKGIPIDPISQEGMELNEMEWHRPELMDKIFKGSKLTTEDTTSFIKTKFHTAREIEHYQHDILNRMITKEISLIALPSSNLKLTRCFPDYKDHPFSWWEKKGVKLGIGTDNYVTLETNFIKEMLILLYSDSNNLKITKLLMLVTGEKKRPYLSSLLWEMRRRIGK